MKLEYSFFSLQKQHNDEFNFLKGKSYFFEKMHCRKLMKKHNEVLCRFFSNLKLQTATGFEPTTTQFVNEHSTIWPN